MIETENRYLEEGMEFISFFMFIAWNALLTNFSFGKGESQTAYHFLSFDSLMSEFSLFRKLDMRCKTTKNFGKYKLLRLQENSADIC